MTDLDDRLAAARSAMGDRVRSDVPLAPFCTYRVGGTASLFVDVASSSDLERLADAVARSGLPTLVVGKGSNLLVTDTGFPGIALRLTDEFAGIEIDAASGEVGVGAAALLPVVARRTAAAALTGFEWAVGVPGSIGGAVRMNAGGHGSDMAASLRRAGVFDLATGGRAEWSTADLELGYRRSALEPRHVVLSAELVLLPGDRHRSEAEISEIVAWRRANQPGGQNAGSVFTNPPGDSAGRLIDVAGLKGLRHGSASVSTKHANFIQADLDGSADDVYTLIDRVRRIVFERFGTELHCENKLIGFPPLPGLAPAATAPAPCRTGEGGGA